MYGGQEQLYQRHLVSLSCCPVTLVQKTQGSMAKASGWLEMCAYRTVTSGDIAKVLSILSQQ